jgi:leucyl-tRNA synthetase
VTNGEEDVVWVLRGLTLSWSSPFPLVFWRDEFLSSIDSRRYLDYGNEEWKNEVRVCLDQVNTYSEEVRRNFLASVDWLHEYACSRSFGLGMLFTCWFECFFEG